MTEQQLIDLNARQGIRSEDVDAPPVRPWPDSEPLDPAQGAFPMPDVTPPTADELAVWQAACDAILSPGPWDARYSPGAGWEVRSPDGPVCAMAWWQFDSEKMNGPISEGNAKIAAIARTALPRLLAHVAALTADNGRLREVVQWFMRRTDIKTRWPCNCCGRQSADTPLRTIHVRSEEGKESIQGCWVCNTDDIRDAARAALAGRGEGGT